MTTLQGDRKHSGRICHAEHLIFVLLDRELFAAIQTEKGQFVCGHAVESRHSSPSHISSVCTISNPPTDPPPHPVPFGQVLAVRSMLHHNPEGRWPK